MPAPYLQQQNQTSSPVLKTLAVPAPKQSAWKQPTYLSVWHAMHPKSPASAAVSSSAALFFCLKLWDSMVLANQMSFNWLIGGKIQQDVGLGFSSFHRSCLWDTELPMGRRRVRLESKQQSPKKSKPSYVGLEDLKSLSQSRHSQLLSRICKSSGLGCENIVSTLRLWALRTAACVQIPAGS